MVRLTGARRPNQSDMSTRRARGTHASDNDARLRRNRRLSLSSPERWHDFNWAARLAEDCPGQGTEVRKPMSRVAPAKHDEVAATGGVDENIAWASVLDLDVDRDAGVGSAPRLECLE